jgi:hypothetical protein
MKLKRWIAVAATIVVAGTVAVLAPAASASAAAVQLTDTSAGWDTYTGGGYRYGPSSIINADGSIDQWTCGNGSGTAWDYIYWSHSSDGGQTWTTSAPAQAPTPGSQDAFSTCDPGVIQFGGYYYMGYTSTQNSGGSDNQLYMSRSTSPSGGFQKWNGSGWGGNPVPIISYTGPSSDYGIGEPSLVDLNGTLYIYYTYIDGTTNQTRVATAPDSNANWPSAITLRGTAILREQSQDAGNGGTSIIEDSTDIKYVDALGMFIGVGVGERLQAGSYVTAWESTDGLTFQPATFANQYTKGFAHNIGLSGTPNGHLNVNEANFISYAYGSNWGHWNTHLTPISIAGQTMGVTYSVQAQNVGWEGSVVDNRMAGTPGSGLRVEAYKLQLTNPSSGVYVQYQAYVQNTGWQNPVYNGSIAGTVGQSLRIEAVKMMLDGPVPAGYHIKYRVYQNGAWSAWFVDNQQAGVTGQSLQIESIQAFIEKN